MHLLVKCLFFNCVSLNNPTIFVRIRVDFFYVVTTHFNENGAIQVS